MHAELLSQVWYITTGATYSSDSHRMLQGGEQKEGSKMDDLNAGSSSRIEEPRANSSEIEKGVDGRTE